MNSDFKELLQAFETFEVEYLIVGGYAVMAYSGPRYAKDLDIWVRPEPGNASEAWLSSGPPLDKVKPQDFATEGLVFQA